MLPISILRELWDLPNNNIKNPVLLNILLTLKDLLKVFLGK